MSNKISETANRSISVAELELVKKYVYDMSNVTACADFAKIDTRTLAAIYEAKKGKIKYINSIIQFCRLLQKEEKAAAKLKTATQP